MDKSTETPKQLTAVEARPLGVNVERLGKWREERLKDADGFLAGRLLWWFLQRDELWFGRSFAMEYGKSKKYIHLSEVIMPT